MTLDVGAFVSTAGGVTKAVERATALSVTSIMIFASSPRSFTRREISVDDAREFRAKVQLAALRSVWIHGSYLMNFASASPVTVQKSVDLLIAEMKAAHQLGAKGVIFHIGSHGGRGFTAAKDQLVQAFRAVLDSTPDDVWLIFENAAGQGGTVGVTFEELGVLVRELASERVKICLDTAHAFAAGYPIQTIEGLNETLQEFEKAIGLEWLVAIHLNDSKVDFNMNRDRHENIGEGKIGEAGMRVILGNSLVRSKPLLLEVPGAKGEGPDLENVSRVRAFAV